MKRLIALIPLLLMTTGESRASFLLSTSNPPGSPLVMSAGTVSGPMFTTVVSNNPTVDVMSAWNIGLKIVPDAQAVGTLTFQDPATGTPAPPPNYAFTTHGLGISATNTLNQLTANDFFDPTVGIGTTVPSASGANLLQMAFRATTNASGVFGIYAVEGAAFTQWTDGQQTTQFFSNVPGGTSLIRIGEVRVLQAVPEPSALALLGVGGAVIFALRISRSR